MKCPKSVMLMALGAVVLSCGTTPAEPERAARRSAEEVGSRYRPDGKPPPVPKLNVASVPEDFVRRAALRSPQVEARYHAWRAAIEDIVVARSLPDPMISLSFDVGSMLTQILPAFGAMFPPEGRLKAAALAQTAGSEARRAAFELAVYDVAAETWSTYFEAALIEETLVVDREIVGLLGELEDLVGAQVRVGKVTQQDLLRVGIERDQLRNELATLEDARTVTAARLGRLLGWTPDEGSLPLPKAFPPTSSEIPDYDLVARLLTANREIGVKAAELREAEAMVAVAHTTGEPDFTLSLGANLMTPKSLMPGIGLTLPLWGDKVRAQVAGAAARRDAAGSELAMVRLSQLVALAEATFQWRDAGRRGALYADRLIPKAEAALDVSRTGYSTSKSDINALLDAERGLRVFRIGALRARADREASWARIVYQLLSALSAASELATTSGMEEQR